MNNSQDSWIKIWRDVYGEYFHFHNVKSSVRERWKSLRFSFDIYILYTCVQWITWSFWLKIFWTLHGIAEYRIFTAVTESCKINADVFVQVVWSWGNFQREENNKILSFINRETREIHPTGETNIRETRIRNSHLVISVQSSRHLLARTLLNHWNLTNHRRPW